MLKKIKRYLGKPILATNPDFNISSGFLAENFRRWHSSTEERLGLERHTICCIAIIIYIHGGMAQSVEHIVHIDGVVGSSPTVTTTRKPL